MRERRGVFRITGGRVLCAGGVRDGWTVEVTGGKIGYVGPPRRHAGPCGENISAEGNYVGPGFIDLHVHGAEGVHFLDCGVDAVRKIASAHARRGTTAFLATLGSSAAVSLRDSIECLKKLSENGRCPGILGIHLEGPYINPVQRGVHSERHVRPADEKEILDLIERAGGLLKMVTLAPEIEGSAGLIRLLKSLGITAAAGHSNASLRECEAAFDSGVRYVTHLFNAMSGLNHRAPGLAAAALADERVFVELIADGAHVHPLMIKLAVKLKGWERVILVTDCVKALDSKEGDLRLDGRRITVEEGVPRLDDGTLCGSILTMNKAVRNLRDFTGGPLEEVVKLATLNPARAMGIENKKGALAPGMDADIVIFDEDIDVKATIIGGEPVFGKL